MDNIVEAQIARADPASRRFGIATLDSLREHLQWAIELEHATLPSYRCALYWLDPARNPEATEVMLSVFLEEMQHAFNGSPRMLRGAINAMYGLKKQAEALMQTPTHDGLAVAGPTFEYVLPDEVS